MKINQQDAVLRRAAINQRESPDNCEAVGHDEETTYDDETLWQGFCRRCGAELESEK